MFPIPDALSGWPAGRVGFAESGPRAGEFIFVFPEIEGRWGYYGSEGTDDILPDAEYLEWRLEQESVRWLAPDVGDAVERHIFKMRPLVGSQYDLSPSVLEKLKSWFSGLGRASR